MERGIGRKLFLFLLMSIFLSSFCFALGDWKQFGKDNTLSEYQPYSIPANYTTPITVSAPAIDDMLVVIPNNVGSLENYNAIQDYVIDDGANRFLVAFVNVTNTRQIRLYKIVNKAFQLQSTVNLQNLHIFATATYDLDNDGSQEIIVYQDDRNGATTGFFTSNISIWGIQGTSLVTEKSFRSALQAGSSASKNNTIREPMSNMVCSDFLGGTCFIMGNTISGRVNNTFMLFNYSYSKPEDNLMSNYSRITSPLWYGCKGLGASCSNPSFSVTSAVPRVSVVDVMGGVGKEIIFTLITQGGYAYPDSGQLVILNETDIPLKKFSVVRNLTEFTGDTSFLTEVYHYETITKASDMNNDGENEIVIGINTALSDENQNITSYTIADNSGSKLLELNNYDNSGLSVANPSYLSHYFTSMQENSAYCPSPLDFTLFDFFGDADKEVVITSNEYGGVTTIDNSPDGDCKDYFSNTTFNLGIRNFSNVGYQYFTESILGRHIGSYGYQTIFDNSVVGIESGIFYPEMVNLQFHTFDFFNRGVIYGSDCEFREMGSNFAGPYYDLYCPRTIYADVDNDGHIEFITHNTTSLTINTLAGATSNQNPVITSLKSSTGTPICFNSSSTYNVNYTDNEADTIYIRADCKGNGTYTVWSANGPNPSVTCKYDTIGNIDTGICITDISHYPDSSSCINHSMTVTYSNCFETDQGGGSTVYQNTNATGYNIFGIKTGDYVKQPLKYQSAYGFNWDACSGYTIMYGACPLVLWIKGIAIVSGDWIFDNFWVFLILIFIMIIVVFIKRSMR